MSKISEKEESFDAVFKIMVIGDSSVGKTSFVIKYTHDIYLEELKDESMGVAFYSKIIDIKGRRVKLYFWDFGVDSRLHDTLYQYCKGANGVIYICDITNRASLEHLPNWTGIVRGASGNIPFMVVGSKLDLKALRAFSNEEGMIAAEKYNIFSYVEVSAKTGEGFRDFSKHNFFEGKSNVELKGIVPRDQPKTEYEEMSNVILREFLTEGGESFRPSIGLSPIETLFQQRKEIPCNSCGKLVTIDDAQLAEDDEIYCYNCSNYCWRCSGIYGDEDMDEKIDDICKNCADRIRVERGF